MQQREIKYIGWNGTKWLPVRVLTQEYAGDSRAYVQTQLSAELIDGSFVKFDTARGVFPVRQYTGLNDKNSVEIYEGDIVRGRTVGGGTQDVYEVYYADDCGQFEPFGEGDFAQYGSKVEVIGNIYENPELLG